MTYGINSLEAQAKRRERALLERSQRPDVLAERARKVAIWKQWAKSNTLYRPSSGCWWLPFVVQRWGWRLLMPKLRVMIEQRERDRRAVWLADMRAYSARCAQAKAERKAAAARSAAPQCQLFDAEVPAA